MSGECVGSERRGGKEERQDRQIDAAQAVDRWMAGQTDKESTRVRVTEKVGATVDGASEERGPRACTQVCTHPDAHTGVHRQ